MKRNKKFLLEFTKNDLSHVVDMGNEITVAYEIELDSADDDWIHKYAEIAGYFISNPNKKDEKEVTVEMINNGRWEPFLTFDIFNKSLRIKSQDVSRFNVGDAFIAWLESINEGKANYYIATTLAESGYLNKFNLSREFKKSVTNILNNQYRPSEISKYIVYHPNDEKMVENLSMALFSSENDKDILAQIIDGLLKYIPKISQADSEFAYIGDNLKKILALIESGVPVIALATQKSVYEKTLSNIKEVKARDAVMIGIAAEDDNELEKYVDHVIKVPATDELLIPLLTVVPLQLLAYYAAITRGCDVDKPRNLAKSVTVE